MKFPFLRTLKRYILIPYFNLVIEKGLSTFIYLLNEWGCLMLCMLMLRSISNLMFWTTFCLRIKVSVTRTAWDPIVLCHGSSYIPPRPPAAPGPCPSLSLPRKKKQVPVNEAFAHKPHASSILYPSFLPLDSIVTIKKKFDTLVFCIAYFY